MAKFILYIILIISTIMNAGHQSAVPSTEICPNCGNEISAYEDSCQICADTLEIAVSSENFTVDEAMMTYFISESIVPYSPYLSLLGVDTSESLKTQAFTGEQSWYDYFAECAMDYVGELLVLCEYAHEHSITLTESDYSDIDSYISSLTAEAKALGHTTSEYISTVYGKGVTEDVLRRAMELESLSDLAYNHLINSANYTSEELLAFRDTYPEIFLGVDYISYLFEITEFTKYDDNGISITFATEDFTAARDAATALSQAKSPEEFTSIITSHLTDIFDEEFAATYNIETRHATRDYFNEDVADWAFSAKVGDTMVENSYDGTWFCVYMITKTPYIDEEITRNLRQIFLSTDTYMDRAEAEIVFSKWEKAGFSDEAFEELVNEYSEMSGSGLYLNLPRGATVEEVEDWVFAAERQVGDRTIVDSIIGWHIIEYLGEGEYTSWESTARAYKSDECYSSMISEGKNKITYYDEVIYSLDF